jgi:hypothetical protein
MGSFVNPSGLAGQASSAANAEDVTSGDEVYTVNLTRTGSTASQAYGIILRGDATAGTQGRWNNGYAFLITRTSRFSVLRWTPAVVTTLASGTAPLKIVNNDTPANTQATNTLRVVASGSTFTFFVNDMTSPVATVTNGMFATGQVGVIIRRELVGVNDELKVNHATLVCGTSATPKMAAGRANSGNAPEPIVLLERPTTRLTPRRR